MAQFPTAMNGKWKQLCACRNIKRLLDLGVGERL